MAAEHHRTSKRRKMSPHSMPRPSADASPFRLCDLNDDTPLDQLLALSQSHGDRWREIQTIQREISWYRSKIDLCQSKIQQLKLEHKRATLPTLLKAHPKKWVSLGESGFEKENMIAALQSTSLLPDELYGDYLYYVLHKSKVMGDRDVYLAVLDRDDFCRFYRHFGVPDVLRGDKEIMLRLVERYPEYLEEEDVPAELLDDSDAVYSFVRGSLHKAVDVIDAGLGRFSPRIRADESLMLDVVLAICSIDHDPTKFKLKSISDSPLMNDKVFCLHVADTVQTMEEKSRRSCPILLRDLSSELRDDQEVVTAFCTVNGLNVEYASSRLRCCSDVVSISCKENAAAVISALACQKLSDLLTSKEFVLLAFAECRIPELFDILPLEMRQDRDVAVAVSLVSMSILERIKEDWKLDRDFWRRVLKGYSQCHVSQVLWVLLPAIMQHDHDTTLFVARHAISIEPCVFDDIVRNCPQIMSDREVLRNIVSNSTGAHRRSDLDIFRLTPLHIFEDKLFCMELLRLDGVFYRYLPMHLQGNRDVVEAALWRAPGGSEVLRLVPENVQVLYPDLVARAIRKNGPLIPKRDFSESLRFQREVALALVSTGYQYSKPDYRQHFADDKEFNLALAKHQPECFRQNISWTLSLDRQFMLEVVKINGKLICCADDRIRFDYDLLLAAFSSDHSVAYELIKHDRDEDYVVAFADHVRECLRDYMAFKTVVQGVSLDSPTSESSPFRLSCPLYLLNQGSETTVVYKRLIAEYCGIPLDDDFRLWKRVAVELARWGF